MRVLRGRASDREADRELTGELAEWTVESGEPGLRVWRPHRHCSFGRLDARSPGYDRACEIAADRDFPPEERRTGGRAVAYTDTTVAFVKAEPIEDLRAGIPQRYDATTRTVQRVLWRLGVPAQRGEPPDSFCPGNHSLQWRGKLVGLAQCVRTGVAIVGGVVIVRDNAEIADVLEPVYGALSVPFDPESVGSLASAGGEADPDVLIEELEAAFLDGDAEPQVWQADREV